jgi:hypothetical protein
MNKKFILKYSLFLVCSTGSDRIIDVIDVTKQSDLRMALKDFVEYYSNPLRSQQVLNVISLEFSGSK